MPDYPVIAAIIAINVSYVSLFTIRLIFVMRGRTLLASFVSMAEVFIYLIGLNLVLGNMDKPANLLAYVLGWAGGVWVGSRIEEWLALGYVTMQIVVNQEESRLPELLRSKGWGVTSWPAEGKDGPRLVMQVLAKRSNEKKLLHTIKEASPKAFIVSYEPRYFRGGFWTKKIK